jgi:hypothetical protein
MIALTVTPETAEFLARKYAEAEIAKAALDATLATLLRQHGHKAGTLLGLNGLTLTVALPPDPAESGGNG